MPGLEVTAQGALVLIGVAGAVAAARLLKKQHRSTPTDHRSDDSADHYSAAFMLFLGIFAATAAVRQWGSWNAAQLVPIAAAAMCAIVVEAFGSGRIGKLVWAFVALMALALGLAL